MTGSTFYIINLIWKLFCFLCLVLCFVSWCTVSLSLFFVFLFPVSSPHRNRSSSVRRRWSTASSGHGVEATSGRRPSSIGGATNITNTTTTTTASSSNSDRIVKLHVGMQVLLSSASEMGTIRYLGTADFAPGLWLGLELRSARGKNDGSVEGRRYFSCRQGYGVLVRPSRVTYRGINGSKLVDESGWASRTASAVSTTVGPPL